MLSLLDNTIQKNPPLGLRVAIVCHLVAWAGLWVTGRLLWQAGNDAARMIDAIFLLFWLLGSYVVSLSGIAGQTYFVIVYILLYLFGAALLLNPVAGDHQFIDSWKPLIQALWALAFVYLAVSRVWRMTAFRYFLAYGGPLLAYSTLTVFLFDAMQSAEGTLPDAVFLFPVVCLAAQVMVTVMARRKLSHWIYTTPWPPWADFTAIQEVYKEFELEGDETRLGRWMITYIPPAGGRYLGDLTITTNRILFQTEHDIAADASGLAAAAAVQGVFGASAGYFTIGSNLLRMELPRREIDQIDEQGSGLSHKVGIVSKDGSVHIFDYGILSVAAIMRALKRP